MPNNPDVARIERAFERKRQELGVRSGFSDEVLRAVDEAAKRDPTQAPGRVDRTDVELVTIDPPGSKDLDQALCIERTDDGFRVWYAIADVGFWVDRGGPIEKEAWLRGVTFYAPDRRDTLYPPQLSEGAASLLPDAPKPSILFSFVLDEKVEIRSFDVERAIVRSRAQLTYQQVLQHVEEGGKLFAGKSWAGSLEALKAFGEARRQREIDRGGVSLPLLTQHVERSAAARLGYEMEYEQPNASEDWNAQVSLLTGHAAATKMIEGRIGLLRTLPPADPAAIEKFRHVARTLGFDWPEGTSYADFIRSIDPCARNAAPLVWQAKRVMKGADYVAFDGEVPEDPEHHALAMVYAHCTAPLRRLADRYVLELVADLCAGTQPPAGEAKLLTSLANTMNEAETRGGKLERGVVDVAEAWMLSSRIGESFPAAVLGVRNGHVEVQIQDPPVRAEATRENHDAFLDLGQRIQVKLTGADVEEGKTSFSVD